MSVLAGSLAATKVTGSVWPDVSSLLCSLADADFDSYRATLAVLQQINDFMVKSSRFRVLMILAVVMKQ